MNFESDKKPGPAESAQNETAYTERIRQMLTPVPDIRIALQQLSLNDLEQGRAAIIDPLGTSWPSMSLYEWWQQHPDIVTGDAVVFDYGPGFENKIIYGYFDIDKTLEAREELQRILKEVIDSHPLKRK